jgi:hypothetical protein
MYSDLADVDMKRVWMREIKVYRAKKKRTIITGVAFVFRHLLCCASFNYPARVFPEGRNGFGNVLESNTSGGSRQSWQLPAC